MIVGPYDGVKSAPRLLYSAEDPDVTPLEWFDQGEWAKCAHACIFLLWRSQDPQRALAAMNDEMYLHELLHLTNGIKTSDHNTMAQIRQEIEELMEATCLEYVRRKHNPMVIAGG